MQSQKHKKRELPKYQYDKHIITTTFLGQLSRYGLEFSANRSETEAITGGGLHGKDLSKADVSVNIYAFLKAQETGEVQQFCCAIGDTEIDSRPYAEIVDMARDYIKALGGFERFAEWGLF